MKSSGAQHGVGESGPSPDQLYVSALMGRQVASLDEQGPAFLAAASLGLPAPPEARQYGFDRREVAQGLSGRRPSMLDLHAAALLFEGYGGPARQTGRVAGGTLTALGMAVALPAMMARESLERKHPVAGGIFKGIENGAAVVALGGKGLAGAGLQDLRRATDRVLGIRYGERVVPTDSQRAAGLRGMLLGRLARIKPEDLIPDEAYVQLAAQYMQGFRRSRITHRIGRMSLALGRAYIGFDNHGIEDTAKRLIRMRRAGTPYPPATVELNHWLAARVRQVAAVSL